MTTGRWWIGAAAILALAVNAAFAGGSIFIADQNESIRVFDAMAAGDTAPRRVVAGTNNTLFARNSPVGIDVDEAYMYTTIHTTLMGGAVGVFALPAEGDASPVRLIGGDLTLLAQPQGLAVDTQFIYVANYAGDSILVFPLNADGNTAPARTLFGVNTLMDGPYDVAVDDQFIYVANYHEQSITVYNKTDSGNTAPQRTIAGALTGLSWPQGIAVNGDSIFVTDMSDTNQVKAFALNANGNTAPVRIIQGENTGLFGPWGIDVDSEYLYVGNFSGLTVFRPTDTGNVTPVRTIEGPATGIRFAQGVAVLTDWSRDPVEPDHPADPLDYWHWRNPLPDGRTMYDAVYGDNQFVAVGWSGTLFTSPDGQTWEGGAAGTNSLHGVAYGAGLYVAAGSFGTILTSPDGQNWAAQESGTPRLLNDVIYAGGRFVAGANTLILTSPDGITWTKHPLEPLASWDSLAYGNGTYVAVGWGGTNGVCRVSDTNAAVWTEVELPVGELAPWGVTYGDGLFVIAGYDQENREALVLTSSTGTNWTRQAVPHSSLEILRGITYADHTFVAVGGSSGDTIYTSPDGTNWTVKTPGLIAEEIYGVCYGNGRFIACGSAGLAESSTDGGDTWTLQTPGTRNYFESVAYGNGRFVAIGPERTNHYSANGVTWFPDDRDTNRDLCDVVFANGLFVAVGLSGAIATSPDGLTWTARSSGTINWLRNVEYIQGAFYAVGWGGTVLRSQDGITWEKLCEEGGIYNYEAITYGNYNGTFVVAGSDLFGRGCIAYSASGSSWTLCVQDAGDSFTGVKYGAGRFVVVGANKMSGISEDGINWTRQDDLWDGAQGLVYENGLFIIPADYSILISTSGTDWQTRCGGLGYGIRDVAFGRGSLVGVGSHGCILQCGLHVPGDFEGDGTTDWATYYPPQGRWVIQRNNAGRTWTNAWGWSESVPVVGDYNGDGISDTAVFWPAGGMWYLRFITGTNATLNFGWGETLPVQADYNGDGMTDIAVYHPESGTWYIHASGAAPIVQPWGWSEAAPVPGDYDGDGKTDVAVYHAESGSWAVWTSGGQSLLQSWGWGETLPVPADYDGDGRTDFAVYWPAGGLWYILYSSGGSLVQPWGWSEVDPVPADYDGDGKADVAVCNESNWYILYSADSSSAARPFGAPGVGAVLPQTVINRLFYP